MFSASPSYGAQQLAAAFRFFDAEGMGELIANHFSYVPDPSKPNQFLTQRFGSHFSKVRASELVLVDTDRPETDYYRSISDTARDARAAVEANFGDNDEFRVEGELTKLMPAIDPTAYCIHGALHRLLGPKRARCILHLHPHYATILSSLQPDELAFDAALAPICQNTARWYRRLKFDSEYGGMALGEEGKRLAKCLESVPGEPDCNVLLMGNHGVLVIGENIPIALDRMFYLERSCRQWVGALSLNGAKERSALSGEDGTPVWSKLNALSPEVAERTAKQWEEQELIYGTASLKEIMRLMDKENSGYRQ